MHQYATHNSHPFILWFEITIKKGGEQQLMHRQIRTLRELVSRSHLQRTKEDCWRLGIGLSYHIEYSRPSRSLGPLWKRKTGRQTSQHPNSTSLRFYHQSQENDLHTGSTNEAQEHYTVCTPAFLARFADCTFKTRFFTSCVPPSIVKPSEAIAEGVSMQQPT